jgi:uncharacterized phage-associated protein
VSSAIKLAEWIISNYNDNDLTQLKLQKLCFYCYGAVLARGGDEKLGLIPFEAWEYGPVVREVWSRFKEFGRDPITFTPNEALSFSKDLEIDLKSILRSYGQLSASELVTETHLEKPWVDAWKVRSRHIPTNTLERYFVAKFASGNITPPKLWADTGVSTIDGIPIELFNSLKEMADSLTA